MELNILVKAERLWGLIERRLWLQLERLRFNCLHNYMIGIDLWRWLGLHQFGMLARVEFSSLISRFLPFTRWETLHHMCKRDLGLKRGLF